MKVSLRSRGAVTVHELAQRHGGGGHQHAAGLVLDGPLEDAARALIEFLSTPSSEAVLRTRGMERAR